MTVKLKVKLRYYRTLERLGHILATVQSYEGTSPSVYHPAHRWKIDALSNRVFVIGVECPKVCTR